MPRACANSGGAQSLVRIAQVPQAEEPCSFGAETVAALACWQARPGMIVTVVDGDGWPWRARLGELATTDGLLVPFHRLARPVESPVTIDVYQALPEKERFEFVLEKLTELGVARIVPFVSRRSSTVAARDEKQRKSHRWPEVLRRAAIQCRRAMIPELGPCLDFPGVLAETCGIPLRLLLYEGEGVATLRDTLTGMHPARVALLVGPEGGFAPDEVAAARAQGYLPVSLGPRILRTETAAISAATVLQFAFGDLW